MRTIILALAILMGVLGIGNGIFMLVSPEPWYLAVPGVTNTGPFNQHLVSRYRPDLRPPWRGFSHRCRAAAHATDTVGRRHRLAVRSRALSFSREVAVGICTADVLPHDLPAVTLPALVGIALTIWAYRQPRIGPA